MAASFDILPYVFEVARMKNGNPSKYAMRYEEYGKYAKMFLEDMSDEERASVVNRVRARARGNKNSNNS